MESASHFRFGDDWRWQARLTVPRWAEEGPGWGMACLVIDALDVAARLGNGQKEASMQSCQEEEGQRQGGWSRNMGGGQEAVTNWPELTRTGHGQTLHAERTNELHNFCNFPSPCCWTFPSNPLSPILQSHASLNFAVSSNRHPPLGTMRCVSCRANCKSASASRPYHGAGAHACSLAHRRALLARATSSPPPPTPTPSTGAGGRRWRLDHATHRNGASDFAALGSSNGCRLLSGARSLQ